MINFTHLRAYTDYSITSSILSVKKIINIAQKLGMSAVGLSDIHNLSAFVKFYKSCHTNKIKPIISVVANIKKNDNFCYQLILTAKNYVGYQQICYLLSESYLHHQKQQVAYIPEASLVSVLGQNPPSQQNIIVLSGFDLGDIGQLLRQKQLSLALESASQWQRLCGDDYFIELQRSHRIQDTNYLIAEMLLIADQLQLPIVATHPCLFEVEQDYFAHEIKVCIAQGLYIDDKDRLSSFHFDQYYKSGQEMVNLFHDLPEAIHNTAVIVQKCNLTIPSGQYFLPSFQIDGQEDINTYFIKLSKQGLQARLEEIFADQQERKQEQSKFESRLDLEIQTILDMNFVGYFLIVADFIAWAKKNQVPVGPGRGSGAGSLVAFSLGITDVEPLAYDLLFERFLNPSRISMPDFDIDFCPYQREKVLDYVKNKYGQQAVAQIATFGTLSSKAVIKDVGRVLGLPYFLCDKISKFILNTPAKSYSLLDAYQEFADLKAIIDEGDDDIKRLWELSLALENLVRNVGKHAAGIVIAPSRISDFCPIYWQPGEMQTAQLDKDDIEAMGLIKFDFLGLTNLTIIKDSIQNIKSIYGQDILLSNYIFDDPAVYKLLQQGNTQSIFQLESPGIKRITMKVAPTNFEDLVAILALYRPGPLGSGMVDDFINRKHARVKIDYMHDDLKTCLQATYGVIVYQEQVMQISRIVGGYSLGDADLLRRAMGKKKPEEMVKHKEIFIKGALENGYKQDLAAKLFDLMALFAEYGFNKSHTVAYAVISYHTAYLKAHYPACFLSATLSHMLDKNDKHQQLYQDCCLNGIELLPPDINQSCYVFTPLNKKQISYALGAIKGIGEAVALAITHNRSAQGDFTSIENFCMRLDKKLLNKKVLESLIKAGCFDRLDDNRFKLISNIPLLLSHCVHDGQESLFDDDNHEVFNSINLKQYSKWSLVEQLNQEKAVLGYCLTADIFNEYKTYADFLQCKTIDSLLDSFDKNNAYKKTGDKKSKKTYKIAGIVNYIGSKSTKNSGQMLFIKIADSSSSIECVLFSNQVKQYRNLIKMDAVIVVSGELTYDIFREEVKINVIEIHTLDQALYQKVQQIVVLLNGEDQYRTFIDIVSLSAQNSAKVIIKYSPSSQSTTYLELGKNFKIKPQVETLQNLASFQVRTILS